MASKQAQAKERQLYTPKLVPGTCSNCVHYRSEVVEKTYFRRSGRFKRTEEKNLRCGVGGFAVRKMGSCAMHASDESKV